MTTGQDKDDPAFVALRALSDDLWSGKRILGVRMHPADAARINHAPAPEHETVAQMLAPELVISERQEQGTIAYTDARETLERWKMREREQGWRDGPGG